MKKRLLLLISGIVFCLIVLFSLKTPKESKLQEKTLQNKEDSIAIMVKEEGATDYTKYSSKDIPKGSYSLNTEKTYCKNNGTVTDYNSSTGTISFNFIGTDKCFLYFDYIAVAAPSLAYERILLANGEGATTVDLAKANIIAKGEPNFSETASDNEGLYITDDDRGTSYYFRGAVDNNWVKFANFYWRIVRINGDDTIRLLYSGTRAPEENERVYMNSGDAFAIASLFMHTSNQYGYQTDNGSPAFGYCPPSEINCDVTNSQMKIALEEWFEDNLVDYENDGVIYPQIFCADFYYEGTNLRSDPYLSGYKRAENFSPINKCSDDGNYTYKFCSVSDVVGDCNQALTYSVGLLTLDEVMMAGGVYGVDNLDYYLYTGTATYLGTGMLYSVMDGSASVYTIDEQGAIASVSMLQELSVRPVISLNSDVMFSGSGTWNDPYVVTNYVTN